MSANVVSFDWLVLAPVLAPAFAALLVLVIDAIAPTVRAVHLPVALTALGLGIGALPFGVANGATPVRTLCLAGPEAACLYEGAAWGVALQLTALVASLLILLMLGPGTSHLDASQHGGPAVTVALVLTATAGATLVPATRDLPTWLIAIELATLPAVALVALSRSRDSARGALALLMTSLMSFGLLVVGLALWVLATGDATFSSDTLRVAFADPQRHRVLLAALLFLLAGLGFKLSAVPFHTWTPQAFTAADEPIGALLATVSKVAALGAAIVVLRPLIHLEVTGEPGRGAIGATLGVLAVFSMTVGNLLALREDDPVRLLAWSTVAQGGWVLLPLAVLTSGGASAAVAYLVAYAAASLAVFAVAAAVHPRNEAAGERTFAAYRGLARSQPLLAGGLALGLLALAGLPPGLVGVIAKIVALRPVIGFGGFGWVLVAVAIANVVLGIAVYVRWLRVVVRADDVSASSAPTPRLRLDPGLLVAVVVSTGLLLVLSVVPGLLLGLVDG